MSSVNLYDVLNVPNNASLKEIKDSHRQLVLFFHPDRKKTGDAEMFDLVNHAYSVLSNPKSRADYDLIHNMSKSVSLNHEDFKYSSQSFVNEQENIPKKSKEEMAAEFEKMMDDLDNKNKYKRKDAQKKISITDTDRVLDDITLSRRQQEIEDYNNRIFEEGEQFNSNKFNAAFIKLHGGGGTDLIPRPDVPLAWNMDSLDTMGSNYSVLGNYDKLYVEDNNTHIGNSLYSTTLVKEKVTKLTKQDIDEIDESSYMADHKTKEVNYDEIIKQRLEEHESQRKELLNWEMDKFQQTDEYGILNKLGGNLNTQQITWDNEHDIKKTYDKLLKLRSKQ